MPSLNRARRHTAAAVLRRIDDETVSRLSEVARRPEAAPVRLHALDREWDVDRVLETEAAAMGLPEAIRKRTDAEVVRLEGASDQGIAQRLRELDREWDIERTLQANASVLATAGVLLGAKVNWWLLPAPPPKASGCAPCCGRSIVRAALAKFRRARAPAPG